MKKLLLSLMLLPLLSLVQAQNVISTFRVFPAAGKSLEFKKALIAHVAKFHTTERKWRIFEVTSGPDAGAFHFVEAPSTWDAIEKAPQNTDAHTTDWDKTVEIFVEKTTNVGYSVYQEDRSTGKLTDYANNIILTHMYPAPGMTGKAWSLIEKMKKVWELGNESIAVFNIANSGEPQIVTSRRLKNGLKELDPGGTTKDMPTRYREANGPDSFASYMEDYGEAFERRWSEMLTFRADLSSK
jgi:hypothetical protein